MAVETVLNSDRFDSDSDPQTLLGSGGTIGRPPSSRTPSLALGPEPLHFTSVDGRHFLLDCSNEIGSGGEAIVVAATDDEGRSYAAKIGFIQQQERSNTEQILRMLADRTATEPEAYRSDHLMPTIAWGTVFAQPLGFQSQAELLVSIMPVCNSLEDSELEPSYVMRTVLPQLAEALHVLHRENIVHRDVKPANVYEYNGTIVLGDFGISTILEQGENVRDTRMNRRTPGYTPNQNGVLKENDWYALGYTLWTMYNKGVHPYQEFIEEELQNGESPGLKQVEFGYRLKDFIPRNDGDETFGQLIFGLTVSSRVGRLGYNDIQRYLEGPATFYFVDESDLGARRSKPYTFEGVTCRDNNGLVRELSKKWNDAIRHLYSGNLRKHFADIDDNDLSTRLYSIVETNRATASNQDLGLAQAIWFISGEAHTLCWKGLDVSLPALVSQFAEHDVSELEQYDETFKSGLLSWSFQQSDDSSSADLAKTLSNIEQAFSYSCHFGRCIFQHTFASGGVSRWAGDTDYDAHASRVLANPCDLYDISESHGDIDDLLASFSPFAQEKHALLSLIEARKVIARDQRDSFGAVNQVGQHFGESNGGEHYDSAHTVNQLLAIIDELGRGCEPAREFAIKYGPMGGWLWVARHSSDYVCRDAKAKELLSEIAELKPSTLDTVRKIADLGDKARHLCDEFFNFIESTPLPVYLGYPANAGVCTNNADAYICAKFYGERVPRGFVRNLFTASEKTCWCHADLSSSESGNRDLEDQWFGVAAKPLLDKCDESSKSLGGSVRFLGESATSIVMILVVLAALFLPDLNNLLVVRAGEPFSTVLSSLNYQIEGKSFVTACLLSAMVFLVCNAAISVWSNSLASGTEKLLAECKSLRERGTTEIAQFFSGTSELSSLFSDPDWNGPLESLDLIAKMSDVSEKASDRTGLTNSIWYKALWTLTAILPAVLVSLVLTVDIAKSAPEWSRQLLERLNQSDPTKIVPIRYEDALGIILAGTLIAVAFMMYWLTSKRRRDGGLWLALVFGTTMALLVAGMALTAVGAIIYLIIMLVMYVIGIVIGLAGVAIVVAVLFGLLSS